MRTCSLHKSERRFGAAIVAPATVFLLSTFLFPMLYMLYLSLHRVQLSNFRGVWEFVGTKQFLRVLRDPGFWVVVSRTLQFVFLSVGLEFVVGLLLALGFYSLFKKANFLTTLVVIPVMLAPLAVGLMWRYMLSIDHGFVNQLLGLLRIPSIPWLSIEPLPIVGNLSLFGRQLSDVLNLNWGFLAVVLIDVWQTSPFIFLLLLAGLRSLPGDPLEAASVDGASYWQTVRHIVLPMLRPIIGVSLFIRTMDSLKAFENIWALFGNSVVMRTLNIQIYTYDIQMSNYGLGSAASVLVLLLALIPTCIFLKYLEG